MEAVQQVHEAANAALGRAIEVLDKQIRPVQRAYFNCCYACSDDRRKSAEVPGCIAELVTCTKNNIFFYFVFDGGIEQCSTHTRPRMPIYIP